MGSDLYEKKVEIGGTGIYEENSCQEIRIWMSKRTVALRGAEWVRSWQLLISSQWFERNSLKLIEAVNKRDCECLEKCVGCNSVEVRRVTESGCIRKHWKAVDQAGREYRDIKY